MTHPIPFGIRFALGSVVAAATENDDYRENDDPGAVIVKEIAKTVVIHICFLQMLLGQTHYHNMHFSENVS